MPSETTQPLNPWRALRETTGLSQREVERRIGWQDKRGHLSLIERGVTPTEEQAAALRRFYMEYRHGQ